MHTCNRTLTRRAGMLLLILGISAWTVGPASAIEGPSPFQPGSSTGSPAGAMPPPGTYLIIDVEDTSGYLHGNTDNTIPVLGWKEAITPVVVWVSNTHVLGGSYMAYIVQPFVTEGVNASGVGGGMAVAHGYANTTLAPFNVSWKLPHDFYLKIGMAFQVPDGTYLYAGSGATAHELPQSPGNHTLTYEPDAALSYLGHGWDLTVHPVLDFQTKDTITNYQSGNVFYLDVTASKTMKRWTVGLVGNFCQQFTNDVQNGAVVNGNGNKFGHYLLGPMLAYDLGPAGSLKFTGLVGMRATNDLNVSFFHVQYAKRL